MTDTTAVSVSTTAKEIATVAADIIGVVASAATIVWSSETSLIAFATALAKGVVSGAIDSIDLYNQIKSGVELTQAQVDGYCAQYETQHTAALSAIGEAIALKS